MSKLAKKLQLKAGGFCIYNRPEGLDLELESAEPGEAGAAVLVFVRNRTELEAEVAPALEAARRDRLSWVAYPKAGQLGTDLNRDSLWNALAGRGVRPVRQISIDDVWSALRFRPG